LILKTINISAHQKINQSKYNIKPKKMKRLTSVLIVFSLVFYAMSADAQKMKMTTGSDLSFLKGQTQIMVKYSYDNITVGKLSESAYLEKRSGELEADEAGRGEKWKKSWVSDRENRFEPKFEELINKVLEKKGVVIGGQYTDAEYVIEVQTSWTDPGYYVGISSRPAFISGKIIFTKAGDSSKELAVIEFVKAPGNSMMATWDTGERIKESYAKLAKTLGGFMIKKKAF
jgi:hypothetical protein